LLPEITKSILLSANSPLTGFKTNSPLTFPTLTAATGPFHGIFEIASAAEAAIIESVSGSFSPSIESTVTTT
jgi:hypothetical protein